MNAGMPMSFLMVLLFGSGPNELLDLLPTREYWQAQQVTVSAEAMLAELKEPTARPPDIAALVKDLGATRYAVREAAQKKILAAGPGVVPQLEPLLKSSDPEIAARAQDIIRRLSGQVQSRAIRRLMAIRTLGELKHRPAAAVLKRLTASKELFVAEYARRALAAIEGRSLAPPTVAPERLAEDVALLPKECSLVWQYTFAPGGGVLDWRKALTGLGPMVGNIDANQVIQQLLPKMVELADKLGNVRVEAFTMGVSGNVSGREGFVVMVARGQYDAKKAAAALKELMASQRGETTKIGGLDVYLPDNEFAVILASNERVVGVAGPRHEQMPLEAVAKAIASGKGTLAENRELAAMIRAVDKTGPIWGVAKMTEVYRKSHPMLAPVTAAALSTKMTDKGLSLVLTARGEDPNELATAAERFNTEVREVAEQMAKATQAMPPMRPMVDFVRSLQAKPSGQAVRVTGRFAGSVAAAAMRLPTMLFLGVAAPAARAVKVDKAAAVRAEPAPPAKRGATTRPAPPKARQR